MTTLTERVRKMIAVGQTAEAAELAKIVAHALPEGEVRELLRLLADAIIDPIPRRTGDKLRKTYLIDGKRSRDEFEIGPAIVFAVDNFDGIQTEAFTEVGDSFRMSEKTVEKYYRKWKKMMPI